MVRLPLTFFGVVVLLVAVSVICFAIVFVIRAGRNARVSTTVCPRCQQRMPREAKFCPRCGGTVSEG